MDRRPAGEEERDLSLQAPALQTDPGPACAAAARRWQGIPGIERAAGGRLWAVWYTGGDGEGPDNYVVLVTSEDDGGTWSGPKLVIDPPGKVRACDPCLWRDPVGGMWLFWAQSYQWFDGRCGVWSVRCEDPDNRRPTWSPPRRIGNGIMLNKPTVLSTGEWLLPAAVWDCEEPKLPDLAGERYSNVICSADQGRTWHRRGRADVPDRTFDEHMIVERRDGSLWMLVRTKYGIGQSVSNDRGATWSPGSPSTIPGPDSRFFLRRLRSGRLLLVNHHRFEGRSHLTALLSEDDGATWPASLLLDARRNVSYPDGVEAGDGRIFVIYDRERQKEKEILLAVFREADVLQGRCVSADTRLKEVVNRAGRAARA